MQKTLNAFGYGLDVDGVFGPATENAVKAVQKKLGLIATGVWDTTTAEKVNGVTKSGVIDASTADRAAVAVRQAPASSQTIDSTATAMTYGSAAPSFFDTLQARVKAFIASPNYPYYLVGGIVVVGAAAYLLLGGSGTKAKPMSLGLGRLRSTRKRKSAKRKSKKSTKEIYVNFATTPKGPFLTESFTSMSSAQKAMREARAAGETAHIAGR